MTRDYKEEYREYHGTPEQIKRRAARVKARRYMEKNGKAHNGDGRDVDHRDGNPLNDSPDNLQMRSRHANRGDKTK
ncbi:MAG: HNH endonuclease [Micrococcales bacterium]|nr:HNH endonuclease [Micrococcales bacterium]